MPAFLQDLQTLPIFCNFILFLVFIFAIFLAKIRGRNLPLPPGPRGLPLIGNMFMMDQLTHRGLVKLANKYGGLCHFKIGHLHMVAISTAEMAHEVLQTQDNIFSNRPATISISYLTYNRADMAFAHYGPFWRQMRKICVMKVFSRKRAESWASVREEIDDMIKQIGEKIGASVNVGEIVFGLTKNIIHRAAFGSMSREGQDEFVKIMQEFSRLFGAFNIGDFIPWLGWIQAREFNNRLVKARSSLDQYIDKIIDEHIKKQNKIDYNSSENDMVDELLAFYNKNGGKTDSSNVQDFSISITRDNIKALIMDVMFGGTETVASAIEWAMTELITNWEELRKVQQELAQVVGLDRKVDESDLDKLTCLKCVIKETLRLHPPIPLLLHETAEETSVNGYRIPAKTRVMVNAWAIGRDKSAWDEPNMFKPSRFLEKGAPDFKGFDFEFIPFGSGRRSCPGMQLGLYALELAVANLCHSFNWGLPDGMKSNEVNMNDVFGLTAPKATHLVAVPNLRLNCPLF